MTQEIITYSIIVATVGYVVYSIIHQLKPQKQQTGCSGCSGCSPKETKCNTQSLSIKHKILQ